MFSAGVQQCVSTSRKRPRTTSGRRATQIRRLVAEQIRTLRTDAGLSLRQLGEAARVDPGYLQQVEAGHREPSISVLAAVGETLGADLSVRLYPNTGPRVRDHVQAAIVEELLRIAHQRWKRFAEVPVYRPARGRVDTVLLDPSASIVVATEVQSQVRRLEQQLGWAKLKAESLPSADFWRHLDREPKIGQLLVLRSSRANRELAKQFAETLRVAYPTPTVATYAAVVADGAWPGAGLLWAAVDDDKVRILERPPRGVTVGR